MSSEEDLMIEKNARWAKILGVLTVLLLTMGIGVLYSGTESIVFVFLGVLSFSGAALSFVGTVIMIFFTLVDDC